MNNANSRIMRAKTKQQQRFVLPDVYVINENCQMVMGQRTRYFRAVSWANIQMLFAGVSRRNHFSVVFLGKFVFFSRIFFGLNLPSILLPLDGGINIISSMTVDFVASNRKKSNILLSCIGNSSKRFTKTENINKIYRNMKLNQ